MEAWDLLHILSHERYGRYPTTVSANDLAGYFYLNDDDLDWISKKRSEATRLGYALQLTSVRFVGTFLENDTHVPPMIVQLLASQVNVANLSCLNDPFMVLAGGHCAHGNTPYMKNCPLYKP